MKRRWVPTYSAAMMNQKQVLLLLAVGSVLPLAGALLSQFGFGFHPCEMCLYQRIPYSVVALLGLWVLLGTFSHSKVRVVLWIALLLWLIEAGLAFYHVGIEEGWWESATGCTNNSAAGASVDDIRAAIMKGPLVSCKDVALRVLGLSMAGWNVLYALGLAVVAGVALRKVKV